MFKETPIYDELMEEIQEEKGAADREAASSNDPDPAVKPANTGPKKKVKRKAGK